MRPELTADLRQYFDGQPALPHVRAFKLGKDVGADMLKDNLKAAMIEFAPDDIHLQLSDKARAVDKLPALTEQAKQVKTGTDDLTRYSTENPVKAQQNPADSVECEGRRKEGGSSVNPF